MKKITVPYIVIAFVFAAALIALGAYLVSFNLHKMLLERLEGSGMAGLVLYIILFIPLLLIRISTIAFIILGLLQLAEAVLALIFVIKNKLSGQKTVLLISLIMDSIMLFYIGLTDLMFIYAAWRDLISGSILFITVTTVITALCVTMVILSAIGFKKLKLMLNSADEQP